MNSNFKTSDSDKEKKNRRALPIFARLFSGTFILSILMLAIFIASVYIGDIFISSVHSSYSFRLIFVSFLISSAAGLAGSVIINRHISNPVIKMIKTLDENKYIDDIVNFPSSSISEIDRLADAVTELQINAKEQASRVSKIISMTDAGIGVFMYDFTTDYVFVGESLIRLIPSADTKPQDTTIPFGKFRRLISTLDRSDSVCRSELFDEECEDKDISISIELYSPEKGLNNAKWYKVHLTRNKTNVLGLIQDVTASVLEKKKIEYERDYDVKTGLLNRSAFMHKVETAFRSLDKLGVAAFVMWDLDNLKYVNDTYGHDCGDDYIKTAANVFRGIKSKGGIVARMSGDEFLIFISGYDSKEEIRDIIEDIRQKLDESFCLLTDGTHFKIRASGGISWFPSDSHSYEMLIRCADFAMYSIKRSTKGSLAEFDIASYSKDSILLTGIEEMNRIIDRQSISYAFQSIISVDNASVYGYEALMRPQSDIFKSPLEFIRIAKTGAKLYEIERITWQLAMRSFKKHIDSKSIPSDTKIFINSLSNCIMNSSDIEKLELEYRDILKNIVLEILENEKVNDEYVRMKQESINKWGAMTALDDFGSGYNSEYALLTLSPQIIKIDRSIISCCDKDMSKRNIISTLVNIASVRNVMVLAEGIETYSEMKTVIECGVDLLQGYYFSHPCYDPPSLDPRISDEIKALTACKRT